MSFHIGIGIGIIIFSLVLFIYSKCMSEFNYFKNNEVKDITYKNNRFKYLVKNYYDEFAYEETVFYLNEGYPTTIKKFILFGPTLVTTHYKEVFLLDYSIENPKISKEIILEDLDEKIKKYEKIRNRQLEILNGDII
jgi:hypothetical protein